MNTIEKQTNMFKKMYGKNVSMITIRFYNTKRRNAKCLKRSCIFEDTATLDYIHEIIGALAYNKYKFYSIEISYTNQNYINGKKTTDSPISFYSGYHINKIYDIESVINNIVGACCFINHDAVNHLAGIHHNITIRQLINYYYHNNLYYNGGLNNNEK